MFFPLFQSVFLNGKYSVVNPAQQAEITGESVIVNAGQWRDFINDLQNQTIPSLQFLRIFL